MALLQFLLRPNDNLSLVHALRAPFFGCSDADLVVLAQMQGDSWWQRLQNGGSSLSATLARAHARTGAASALRGYLGTGDVFDQAMTRFAVAYADQNELDYQRLVQAAADGRVPVLAGV